ncbi:hypothetical protein FVE85_6134 [Porphyridium purpureum]|uniref:Coenzyme Q-binding protein COQ10 START domain-containing protein n=1 Tax=Porphyridium purpureum TaxID=35688 RepID=A0A5J4Z3L0_PORPP|nr:hypothetical protein FVE85_6134 [Porphyridium purpureum]|eukprot:POR3091..scf295_1
MAAFIVPMGLTGSAWGSEARVSASGVRGRRPLRHSAPRMTWNAFEVQTFVENVPSDFAYARFSNFSNMPEWSSAVKRVKRDAAEPRKTSWEARVQSIPLQWEAMDEEVIVGKLISWKSLTGLTHRGRVSFHHNGDKGSRGDGSGTMIIMRVDYDVQSFLASMARSRFVSNIIEQACAAELKNFRQYCLLAHRKERMQKKGQ